MSSPILSARGVCKRVRDGLREATLLDGIDLSLAAGEWVALMGPSGSGKSTLLQILGALDPHYEGEVTVAGERLESLRDAQRARLRNRTLGFVFQAYNLVGHLSVLENVSLPARFAGAAPDRARAQALLERVGMTGAAHRRPGTLSGGERQRVAIARALYQKPTLVLCDEPTGNLDGRTGGEILDLFAGLVADGVALLIATHDATIAQASGRVLQLASGRLVESEARP